MIAKCEFTGRLMDGRRYSDGLHQAIEAKENVIVKNDRGQHNRAVLFVNGKILVAPHAGGEFRAAAGQSSAVQLRHHLWHQQ